MPGLATLMLDAADLAVDANRVSGHEGMATQDAAQALLEKKEDLELQQKQTEEQIKVLNAATRELTGKQASFSERLWDLIR